MTDGPLRSTLRAAAALAVLLPPGGLTFGGPGVPDVRTLSNGLRLVVLEDHAVPLVCVSLWVHAGSKDEIESSAGYAHALEHLVQRGTDAVGPFDYNRLASRWGGSLQVRSDYDRTHITATGVPAALESLIDAVAGMAFRAALKDKEIDLELAPLSQEVRAYYDDPFSVAFLETVRAAFPGHPYRFPPLGNLKTLGGLKHDPLAAFYRNLYVPNNMALIVAGDLEPARASAIAETAFGKQPKSATTPPKPPAPAAFPGHKDIEKKLELRETFVGLAFSAPGYRHPDRMALRVIARALGEPAGGPILSALMKDKSGSAARVGYYGLEDAGLLYAILTPMDAGTAYAAAASALREISTFKKAPLKEVELRRHVDRILREERLRAERLSEVAERLGEAALFGGVRYYWDLPEAYARLTPADIGRAAATYLVGENLRLVVIQPKGTEPTPDAAKEEFHAALDLLGGQAAAPASAAYDRSAYSGDEAWRVTPRAWGNPGDARGLKDPEITVLDNGLAVTTQEDHRHALAAVSLHLRTGSGDDPPGKEGLAYVAAHLIAPGSAYIGRGGELSTIGDKPAVIPEVQVTRDLTELRFFVGPADLRKGLQALADLARTPSLSDASFAFVRKGTLEALGKSGDDPAFVALELFREKAYAGHPYAHPPPGTRAGLTSLTTDDVAAFHRRSLRPSHAVLSVSGDMDAAEVRRLAADFFGSWRNDTTAGEGKTPPEPTRARESATAKARPGEFTRLLSASQSSVIVGVPGVAVGHEDFEDLRLLLTATAVQAFEDMVFARRAAFSASALPEGLRDGGAMAIAVLAAPARRDEAVFDVQRLMRKLALEGPTRKEMETFMRVQSGSEAASLQGVLARASAAGYRQAVRPAAPGSAVAPAAPTPERLKEVAARYFRPDAWIVVKVGPDQ
jgi:zinc protease